jgi:hypothetical protein
MADTVVYLAGDPPLPFKAVDNGDGTFMLAVSTDTAAEYQVFRPTADHPIDVRAIDLGDGTFALGVSEA